MAAGASELLHTERVLALGRVALAAASVALAWVGPGPLPRALPPLLALYGSFSLLILVLAFRAPRRLGPAVRRVYLVDLVWAA